ncbi:MAG: AI-2E family transporter [Holosporaceae bacterium]|jgi:predicted PurR-regulated permease PerM|nr:AI-2E family transporter [Holosporaceae bacterium]
MQKVNGRLVFWIAALAGISLFFFLFSEVCFPFVAGFIVAYICVPYADRMSRYMSRWLVSFLFTICIVSLFALAVVELVPTLKNHLTNISNNSSNYYAQLASFFNDWFSSMGGQYQDEITQIKNEIQKYLDHKVYILISIVEKIASKGNTLLHALTFLVVMPLSFFYFLKDWTTMANYVLECIPHAHRGGCQKAFDIIRRTLINFFSGQFCVMTCLSSYYIVALIAIRVDNEITLGIMSGVFSFIPFIGAMLSCLLVIFFNAPLLTLAKLSLIVLVYLVGQFLESYVFYPKFIGEKTGLHPLWILFSFLAGAGLWGVVGVLAAIPVAAVTRNLIGFSIGKFKSTIAYKQ